MSEAEGDKRGWFSDIESREDAVAAVKQTATGFFVVAALQIALSFWVGFAVILDAVVYIVGGLLLRRWHSRAAAVGLLLVAMAGAAVTVANAVGADLGGGTNILLAVVILWAAIRGVEATFKLHRP
jgi:hypothetical protein